MVEWKSLVVLDAEIKAVKCFAADKNFVKEETKVLKKTLT